MDRASPSEGEGCGFDPRRAHHVKLAMSTLHNSLIHLYSLYFSSPYFMSYVDGFVLAIPKKNIAAYKKMATLGCKVWMKHGALQYVECIGDDVGKNTWSKLFFPDMVKLKKGEVVCFSFIVFRSRAHRDKVNAKVMKDPAMSLDAMEGMKMPFDIKRMAYGGFKAIVER